MCRAVEELCDEARNEEKLENAAKLLRQGKLTREEISEVLGIDTETVDKIAESLGGGSSGGQPHTGNYCGNGRLAGACWYYTRIVLGDAF